MDKADLGLIVSMGTVGVSLLSWFRMQARSGYARERELGHIHGELQQASVAHKEIFNELDQMNDRLSRLEIVALRHSRGSQDG